MKKANAPVIILSDLQTRKAFDIFSILKKSNWKIVCASSRGLSERIFLSLIYLKSVSPLTLSKFESDLEKIVSDVSKKFIYLPVEEDSTLKFYDFIEKNPDHKILFKLPPRRAFNLVRDKSDFYKFCIDEKFPVPQEYCYHKLIKEGSISKKLIIKPKIGSGSVGIKYIDSFEDLIKCKNIDFSKYVIQERLKNGSKIEGAFFLFDEGKLVSYYGHGRIRTFPPRGGVTVYSRCSLNPTLKNLGEKLLERLNWSGFAMVEFLFDVDSGNYKIIEVNPRLWGSIMLSEYCGANFINNYIKISLGEDPVNVVVNENSYIRWFFPWDLIAYIKNPSGILKFWDLNLHNTCYINFTYSSFYRSMLFVLYNIVAIKNILKIYERIWRK